LKLSKAEVRAALQPLHDAGALTYCPYFGDTELCLMNPNYHVTVMKRDFQLLRLALERDFDAVVPVSIRPVG